MAYENSLHHLILWRTGVRMRWNEPCFSVCSTDNLPAYLCSRQTAEQSVGLTFLISIRIRMHTTRRIGENRQKLFVTTTFLLSLSPCVLHTANRSLCLCRSKADRIFSPANSLSPVSSPDAVSIGEKLSYNVPQ